MSRTGTGAALRQGILRGCTSVLQSLRTALTNLFQFTSAVISIYPEIPQLSQSTTFFHGGAPDAIRIEDNVFETFDIPLVYAKSTDGLRIRGNRVKHNHDFEPFHSNRNVLLFEHCRNVDAQEF